MDDAVTHAAGLEDETLSIEPPTRTQSLSSECWENCWFEGRGYHSYRRGENDYLAPGDEQQREAEDTLHDVLYLARDRKLHSAPLVTTENSLKVLDLGSGSGRWALAFADEYPNSQITGVDLSPREDSWTAPNCTFLVDDVETDNLAYTDDLYDFIHIRKMDGGIKNWPALFREAYRALCPGGWLENVETSIEFRSDHVDIPENHVLAIWSKKMFEAGRRLEKPFSVIDDGEQWMRQAGFDDVQERRDKLPVGVWEDDEDRRSIGGLNQLYCRLVIEGLSLYPFIEGLGWSREECQLFLAEVRDELSKTYNHLYYEVRVLRGMKPFT